MTIWARLGLWPTDADLHGPDLVHRSTLLPVESVGRAEPGGRWDPRFEIAGTRVPLDVTRAPVGGGPWRFVDGTARVMLLAWGEAPDGSAVVLCGGAIGAMAARIERVKDTPNRMVFE